jgi:hypothetical protein
MVAFASFPNAGILTWQSLGGEVKCWPNMEWQFLFARPINITVVFGVTGAISSLIPLFRFFPVRPRGNPPLLCSGGHGEETSQLIAAMRRRTRQTKQRW